MYKSTIRHSPPFTSFNDLSYLPTAFEINASVNISFSLLRLMCTCFSYRVSKINSREKEFSFKCE